LLRAIHTSWGYEPTGISLPVKVVLRVAVALLINSGLLARRAVREGDVIVSNVFKEMYLFLFEEEAGGNRVDWSITPAFVEKSTVLIERFEKVNVRLRSEPVQVADFKVGPLIIVSYTWV
jgi:hypothetical protein